MAVNIADCRYRAGTLTWCNLPYLVQSHNPIMPIRRDAWLLAVSDSAACHAVAETHSHVLLHSIVTRYLA